MGFLLSIATRQCDMLEIFYLSARSFTAKKDCPDLGGGVDPCAVPLDLRLVQDTRDEKKPLILGCSKSPVTDLAVLVFLSREH